MATQKKIQKKTSSRSRKGTTLRSKISSVNQKKRSDKNITKEIDKKSYYHWIKSYSPLIAIGLVVLIYILFKTLVVATVNGVPITKFTLYREMESRIGAQTIDSLVTKQLILQAARKNNITVSDDELNKEIEKIKNQLSSSGQDLNVVLAAQGLSYDQLQEEIRIQKIVEKAVSSDINITEDEIDEFITKNKSYLPEDQDTKDESFRNDVKDQIKQQKIGDKMRSWINNLKSSARISYYGSYNQIVSPSPVQNMPSVSSTISPSPSE